MMPSFFLNRWIAHSMWWHARLRLLVHREIRQMLAVQLDKWEMVKLGKVRALLKLEYMSYPARHY